MFRQKIAIGHKDLYICFLTVYLIALPFGTTNLGGAGSILKFFALFPVVIGLLGHRKFTFCIPLISHVAFVFFASISVLWTIDFDNTIQRGFQYFMFFLVLASSTGFVYTEQDIEKIKKSLVWSSRITLVFALCFGSYFEERLFFDGFFSEDPNYLCAYFVFGVVFSLQKITSPKSVKGKILYSIEFLAYLFVILLTGSRGGLLAIFASIGVFFLLYTKASLKSVLLLFLSCFLLLTTLTLFVDYLPETLRERFTFASVAESGGTGRITIWKNGLDVFASSSAFREIFGYGSATIISTFTLHNYYPIVMHNIFLENLVELGVIGCLLYTISIFLFVKKALTYRDLFSVSTISCLIVLSLSTSIYTFKPYYNIMLFIIIYSNIVPAPVFCKNKTQ